MYSNCATAISCTPLQRVQAESGVQWTPLEAEGVLMGRGMVEGRRGRGVFYGSEWRVQSGTDV